MQVDPQRLANHLARLHFRDKNKGIQTVLLRDRFACVARTMDSSLIVSAPGLEGVEPLPREIGVDLPILIGSLRLPMHRERDEKFEWVGIPTDLSLTPERLLLRVSDSTVRLILVHPSTVESQVDPEVAEELFSQGPDRQGVPLHVLPWFEEARQWIKEEGLPEELTKTVPAMAALLKAQTVILEFGPQGGRFLIYGGGKSKSPGIDLAKIPHHLSVKRDYSLNFDVQPLVSLLLKLGRGVPRPRIHLLGPRSPVLFTTGDGYRYLLFPREARRTLRD